MVTPLEVPHNAQNYAYIIDHNEFGRLVFCTDAVRFPYKIRNVNHLLIEANYSDDVLIEHLCNNDVIRSANEHHMEINDTVEAIRNNISPALNTVVLCHLSGGQSDEKMFRERIFGEFGINCYIATSKLTLEIAKDDF